MKISSTLLLPILLADAKRTKSRKQKLRKVDNSGDRSIKGDGERGAFFVPEDHPASNCADRVKDTDASFETTMEEDGMSGTVKLNDYQNSFECMHEIVANENCAAIVVEYESIAVESCGQGCECDQFRFGWHNGNQELQSTANCHCNNDQSCAVVVGPEDYHNGSSDDYQSLGDYEDSYPDYYGDWMLPNDGFSVNSNSFKFYFSSDSSWYKGHVHFKWSCVDDEVTTQPMSTTSYQYDAPTTTTSYYEPTTTTYEPTTTTTEYYPDYASTTTESTTSTTYTHTYPTHTTTTVEYDSDCDVVLVDSPKLCDESGAWINQDKWTRLATYQEVKSQKNSWKNDMGTWYIVSFQQGYANGPGYGSQIVEVPENVWEQPPCNNYGSHLMCLNPDWVHEETTTTSTSWVSTSTSWYDYGTTTTTPYSTPGDDSCYKYHAGFEQFGDAVKNGIRQGLQNDILTYSRRPGVITNGAVRRREQWYGWFAQNFDMWLYEVDTLGDRKCLTNKFPYDSPGDLDKSILGSDCALDLTSIDAICANLKKFMDWAFSDCNSNARSRQLETRCNNVHRIKNEIQQDAARSMAGDIVRANRDIIKHNIEMHKEGKGRYQTTIGPKRKHKPKKSKKSKSKKSKSKKN